MWLKFGLGLAMQAGSLLIILRRAKRGRLSNFGFLFILIACAYHGVTEIIQLIFPDYNMYRTLVDQQAAYNWLFKVSAAILALSIVYSVVHAQVEKPAPVGRKKAGLLSNARLPSWRFLLILATPVYLATIFGKLNPESELGYWATGLSQQYMYLAIVLTSIVFVLNKVPRYLFPVLLLQSFAVFLIGSRFFIVGSAILLVGTVQRYGYKLKRSQLAVAFGLMALMAVTISLSRDVIGRPTSVVERILGYKAGFSLHESPETYTVAIKNDFVYRLDGNSFPAMVNQQLEMGLPRAGLRSLYNDIWLVVPRFLNPAKLDSDETLRDEKMYLAVHYRIPLGTDYIPTTLGVLFSYYGFSSLMIGAVLIGLSLALLDHWLDRTRSLFSLLIGIGWMTCILLMEQGVGIYLITFRGILVLFLFLSFAMTIFKPRKRVLAIPTTNRFAFGQVKKGRVTGLEKEVER
jgi:hypothetical protein